VGEPHNSKDDGTPNKTHQTIINIMILPPCPLQRLLSAMHLS
jgi:hypothetical protein